MGGVLLSMVNDVAAAHQVDSLEQLLHHHAPFGFPRTNIPPGFLNALDLDSISHTPSPVIATSSTTVAGCGPLNAAAASGVSGTGFTNFSSETGTNSETVPEPPSVDQPISRVLRAQQPFSVR